MKLTEMLSVKDICPNLSAKDKLGVLKELVELLSKNNREINPDTVLRVLLDREKLGSTGMENGVAIPHGKVDSISDLLVCFGRSETGIPFDSLDGKPAHLFFLLVAPTDSIGTHLSALARISNLLNDKTTREQLSAATDAKTLYEVIATFDGNDGSGG